MIRFYAFCSKINVGLTLYEETFTINTMMKVVCKIIQYFYSLVRTSLCLFTFFWL